MATVHPPNGTESRPVFQGLTCFVQNTRHRWVVARIELIAKLRQHGAEFVNSPVAPGCKVIFVFCDIPPREGEYQVVSGRARSLKECQEGNATAWSQDDICTHLARTEGDKRQRVHVLGAGWVDDCINQNTRLRPERWNHWEVVKALPKVPRTPSLTQEPRPQSANGSRDPIHNQVPLNNMPISASNTLDCTKHVSAPSTQRSVPGKMFDTFARDPYGVRTFHVVECAAKWPFEQLIKSEGGILDELDDATFIIFDLDRATLDSDLMLRLRKRQIPLSTHWVKDSMELKVIQDIEHYRIRHPGANDHFTEALAEPEAARTPTPESSVPVIKQESPPRQRRPLPNQDSTPTSSTPSHPGVAGNSRPADSAGVVRKSCDSYPTSSLKRPRLQLPNAITEPSGGPVVAPEGRADPAPPHPSRSSESGPSTSLMTSAPLVIGSSVPVEAPPDPFVDFQDAASHLEDLIEDLHQWCRNRCPGTRSAFLQQLRRDKGGLDRVSQFHRNREIVFSRMKALGYDVSLGSKLNNVKFRKRPEKVGAGSHPVGEGAERKVPEQFELVRR